MRAWDAFTGLDSLVKNMVTSLRAVGELQNPAIRDRHWEQLMQATQVSSMVSLQSYDFYVHENQMVRVMPSLVPRPPPRFYLAAVIKSGRRPGNEAK